MTKRIGVFQGILRWGLINIRLLAGLRIPANNKVGNGVINKGGRMKARDLITWDDVEEVADEQFPKGECKERGQMLVVLAYARMAYDAKKV